MVRSEWLLRLSLAAVLPLALLALVAGSAFSAEEEAKKTTATGTVSVQKDENGAVTGVQVGAQKLALDDKAKELAGALADKKVEVTGTLDKDGALKVESYKEVEEKKAEENAVE
jgi:hypothetical protein